MGRVIVIPQHCILEYDWPEGANFLLQYSSDSSAGCNSDDRLILIHLFYSIISRRMVNSLGFGRLSTSSKPNKFLYRKEKFNFNKVKHSMVEVWGVTAL